MSIFKRSEEEDDFTGKGFVNYELLQVERRQHREFPPWFSEHPSESGMIKKKKKEEDKLPRRQPPKISVYLSSSPEFKFSNACSC